MIAYKVFNSDWTCRGFQYQVGETYEEKVSPSVCDRGFHFCKKLVDCFNYYNFDPNNKVAEIEALGDIAEGDSKCCTNVIKIVKELPWHEVLEMVNTGLGNTGHRNTGDWNTGHRNTGDQNTGDQNTGHRNSGDFNLSDNNAGCFNVDDHKLLFFDQETEMTWYQWRDSRAYSLLCDVDSRPTEWIYAGDMSDQDKEDHPSYKTTGGYLKERDTSKAYQEWWDQLDDDQKQCIREIPNFDAKKFEMITGLMIDCGEEPEFVWKEFWG